VLAEVTVEAYRLVMSRAPIRWTLVVAAALTAATSVGCTATLDREWELIAEELAGLDLAVEATIPAAGALGAGRRAAAYLLFTRPLTEDEAADVGDLTFFDIRREITQVGDPDVDFDGQAVRFFPEQLTRNLDYRLTVDLPDEAGSSLEHPLSTALPAGPAFELTAATGLALARAGGEAADADAVTDLFTDAQPLYVLRAEGLPATGPVALPATVDFGMAPGDRGEDLYDIVQTWGYVSWFQGVEIDSEGRFEHRQPAVFFTLYIGGDARESALLRFTDPVLTGRLLRDDDGTPTGIEDFRIEGVLTTRWIRRLAVGVRPWPDVARSLVLDVDTNDNGTPDSATFAFEAQPPLITDPENIED